MVVFQNGEIHINILKRVFYPLNCNLQKLPCQIIPNSQYYWGSQLDPKSQTWTHIDIKYNSYMTYILN